MRMPKHDLSSRHFQRKISEFREVRIAPISSKQVLENLRPYLISLIMYRKLPPILNGHLDWTAIIRWLKAPPVSEDARRQSSIPR
ncbi:hypothetical protein ShzoTeo12_39220 (plasmid) [Shinella zoogloeoides]|nr:hypothetical protein ShzoTeo12_39220 [Shinella zoogloeoides]